jgi:hypothetical protein
MGFLLVRWPNAPNLLSVAIGICMIASNRMSMTGSGIVSGDHQANDFVALRPNGP